jgi:hypothetical protein
MEAGTTQTGCIFTEPGGIACRKLTETGSTMCPHHNLLMAHREDVKAKREAQPKKRKVRRGR